MFTTMNHFTEIKLTFVNSRWEVAVTKEFAPEHGGGTQTFVEPGGFNVHYALDVAKGMVTCSPGQRTDLEVSK